MAATRLNLEKDAPCEQQPSAEADEAAAQPVLKAAVPEPEPKRQHKERGFNLVSS